MFGYAMGGKPSLRDDFTGRRKQFVEVVAEHKLDGGTYPVTIILADGRRYDVELARDPFSSDEDEGTLTVYPIRVRGKQDRQSRTESAKNTDKDGTYLFECANRWYVLMKS